MEDKAILNGYEMNFKDRLRIFVKYFNYTVVGLIVLFALFHSVHYDGPYRGKVVELETGKPIEGAVVAAEWPVEIFVHASPLCDAKETVTDKNGEFELPRGWCINHPFASIRNPQVVVFKPGYLGYPPLGLNQDERRSYMPDWGNPRLFENTRQYNLIKLGRPNTRQEREFTLNKAESLLSHDEALRKLPFLLKLTNKENKSLWGWERPAR